MIILTMSELTYLHCLPREILDDVMKRNVTKDIYMRGEDQILHINNSYIKLNKGMKILYAEPGHETTTKANIIDAKKALEVIDKRIGCLILYHAHRCLVINFIERTQFQGVITISPGQTAIDTYSYFDTYELTIILDWLKKILV